MSGDDRRRSGVPRLRRRDRRQLDRALPPEGDAGDRRAGRAVHPRPGQRVHPRSARAARRQARRVGAGCDRHVLLRQLRGGDHRGRGEAGQAGHQAPEHDRVQRLVPRPHPSGDGDDHVEDGVPRRSRAAARRRVRGPVPRPVGVRSGRRDRRGAHRPRPPAAHPDRAERDGGDDPRTGARRGRLHPRPAGVPRRTRRALPRPRHLVHRRRGAERLRSDREDVRRRSLRHRARHHLHGEGHRLGVPVLRARHPPRARRPVAEGQPRRHVRRQPDRMRGRPGHDRGDERTRLPRQRARRVASSCPMRCASSSRSIPICVRSADPG